MTTLLLALAPLSLIAVCGYLLWRMQRQASDLHDARLDMRTLEQVLDVWQWRTDAHHRLLRVRPPVSQVSAPPGPATLGLPLWQSCADDAKPALRAALEAQRPAIDMELCWTATAPFASVQRGRLRAVALTTTEGGFAGHLGTWHVADAAASATPASGFAQMSPVDLADERESFAYTVSHDLRAPIRVVEGFAKILKEDHGRVLDRIGNDHIDRILSAASRMNSMIDALLALSRLSSQPLARQPVDLSLLAGFIAEDLRRQWPDRLVVLHVQPALQASGDPTLLRVVLENLLGNAWKYTGKAAQPEVWFERGPEPNDAYVVRDNGAGFDMRFADRLFGAFQRLHSVNDFPGTGIGLASVRRILRRHGGDIWAEGEVGRGATFRFLIGPPTPTPHG